MHNFVVLVGDLAIYAAEGSRTPAELQQFAESLVADTVNDLDVADLKLVFEWCLIACQWKTGTNNSLLSLNFRPAAQRDKAFMKWKQDVLRRTLGVEGTVL